MHGPTCILFFADLTPLSLVRLRADGDDGRAMRALRALPLAQRLRTAVASGLNPLVTSLEKITATA